MLWCPKVMVGGSAVIDLKNGLVVFGNENGGVGSDDFANPDVVVIVGVFDGLGGCPFLRFGVKFLLGSGCDNPTRKVHGGWCWFW